MVAIAKGVGLSVPTLKKLYQPELTVGIYDLQLAVEAAHYEAAKSGNVTAQMHILQTRFGWFNPSRARAVSVDVNANSKTSVPEAAQHIDNDVTVEVRMKFDTELRETKSDAEADD